MEKAVEDVAKHLGDLGALEFVKAEIECMRQNIRHLGDTINACSSAAQLAEFRTLRLGFARRRGTTNLMAGILRSYEHSIGVVEHRQTREIITQNPDLSDVGSRVYTRQQASKDAFRGRRLSLLVTDLFYPVYQRSKLHTEIVHQVHGSFIWVHLGVGAPVIPVSITFAIEKSVTALRNNLERLAKHFDQE